ncbi:ABC transporter permease subunit [Bacillus mangrovi]|uniref:ABC transporter permease subunit n=1 Tax=Metabacillus mangrovi TaxID=1491830 RepID=A0A7X2V4W3_9BACI|nr:ABC transporter permease subunit [Metabacillus mangrovi]MTH53504.1 ABC transporter permease subunit [Metabacillus mangrovi]
MQANVLTKRRLNSGLFAAAVILLALGAMVLTEFDPAEGLASIPAALLWGITNFYPDAASFEKLPDILPKLAETLLMSIAAAVSGGVFALAFAVAGSKTTGINPFFQAICRAIATVFRNIDVAVWTMILLFSFGQTPITGYFALFFGAFGFLTRAFMETIDEVSSSSVEALRATGAGYLPIVFQSVLPACIAQMISWLLFMIETSIRSATLVGILTGSGIGYAFNLYYKSLNYGAASLVVLTIAAAILLIEALSNYVRRAVI